LAVIAISVISIAAAGSMKFGSPGIATRSVPVGCAGGFNPSSRAAGLPLLPDLPHAAASEPSPPREAAPPTARTMKARRGSRRLRNSSLGSVIVSSSGGVRPTSSVLFPVDDE
jgi:hypothetical protein